MDIRIRRNEACVVGMPRCDYVFSSTRSCFVAFGFGDSPLEKDIICGLLKDKGIEPVEASTQLAPAQSAFCIKICSKIIASQFCVVLINNKECDGKEIPNANVNMEYGLMLGFNKLILPFQKSDQKLPFNVAGLDTIKYDGSSFKRLASDAIDGAIKVSTQGKTVPVNQDQRLETFLLAKRALTAPFHTEGDQSLHQIGAPLGFQYFTDFESTKVIYFGNFTALHVEIAQWRICILNDVLKGRISNIPEKVRIGLVSQAQADFAINALSLTEIWVTVTSDADKEALVGSISKKKLDFSVVVFGLPEVHRDLEQLGV